MGRQEDMFIARCARAVALAKLDNHNEAEHWFETGEILTATVMSSTEDLGVTIDLDPPVLVSARQLNVASPYMNDRQQLIAVLRTLVGTNISVRAIKVDLLGDYKPSRRGGCNPTDHVVLSERGNLRQEHDRQKAMLLPKLQIGQICHGVVTRIVPFGAFVDLGGGVHGLVHISELSWSNVDRVEDVLQIGDEIEVYVLTLDREDNQIGLSLRRTNTATPSPDGICAAFA